MVCADGEEERVRVRVRGRGRKEVCARVGLKSKKSRWFFFGGILM